MLKLFSINSMIWSVVSYEAFIFGYDLVLLPALLLAFLFTSVMLFLDY